MNQFLPAAREVISRCRVLAGHSEEPGYLTRTFLSEQMRTAYTEVEGWMKQAGMSVHLDHAGNLHGTYDGANTGRRLIIGSHLDTVPRAGIFDGALGVLIGIELVRLLAGRQLNFSLEVIGLSEEEGVRFGVPFIGSLALIGELPDALLEQRDAGDVSIADAIRQFGLDPYRRGEAALQNGHQNSIAYLEFHIEQGPLLESLGSPLGIVETIVGQSRLEIRFTGQANHAGTTPMQLRQDALAGAAEWISIVEREALATQDLVATVGRIEVKPGAGNVIPGWVTVSLDVRHANDAVRKDSVDRLLACAQTVSARRKLALGFDVRLNQPAVAMDADLTNQLAAAVQQCGFKLHRMNSGAGHDAMIMARRMPAAMMFLRSPGGISHHPDESVLEQDVAAALGAGIAFLTQWEPSHD